MDNKKEVVIGRVGYRIFWVKGIVDVLRRKGVCCLRIWMRLLWIVFGRKEGEVEGWGFRWRFG